MGFISSKGKDRLRFRSFSVQNERLLHKVKEDRNCLHTIDRRTAKSTRVVTLIVATIYLQLIQNRYMFRSFTVLQCSHQHCVQPVASDVEVVGYL